jgi:hypothetical protein
MTYLERVDWPAGVRPPCPLCGATTTGLREVEVPSRSAGSRADHQPILVLAEPCDCEVTESAALLQHDAILLEHDLAEGLPDWWSHVIQASRIRRSFIGKRH